VQALVWSPRTVDWLRQAPQLEAARVLVIAGQTDRFLEALCADDLEDWPEKFLPVGLHVGRDPVEQAGADEEALFMSRHREAAAVDNQFGAFVDAGLDLVLDALLCGADPLDDRAQRRTVENWNTSAASGLDDSCSDVPIAAGRRERFAPVPVPLFLLDLLPLT
jgi:hypothetical protein